MVVSASLPASSCSIYCSDLRLGFTQRSINDINHTHAQYADFTGQGGLIHCSSATE